MKKRIFCTMISFALLVSVHLTARADYIHGFFRYTIDDGSVTITSYKGTEEEVTVPNMIGGYPVNVIAAGAFAGNTYVKTVRLPDTVMKIEEGAFGEGQAVIYAQPVKGDVNGDGECNNKDVVFLFRYVSDAEVKYNADYDFLYDGEINNKDVLALFRAVS